MAGKIVLNIVTGALGAGKTTFVQHMVQELRRREQLSGQTEKIIYVVNEFGQSGVDAAIMDEPLPTYELVDGCICCSLKSEFSLMLQQIIEQHQPDRIIFEPSGLFILSELMAALSGESFSHRLVLGSIISLFDVQQGLRRSLETQPFLLNQIGLSDLVAVSKISDEDLAGDTAVLDLLMDLQVRFSHLPLIMRPVWAFSLSDWQQVLDQPVRSIHQAKRTAGMHMVRHQLLGTQKHPDFAAVSVSWQQERSRSDLTERLRVLVSGPAGDIARAKGFVHCEDGTWLIQVVGDQINWHPHKTNEAQRLTVIGRRLDQQRIQDILADSDLAVWPAHAACAACAVS